MKYPRYVKGSFGTEDGRTIPWSNFGWTAYKGPLGWYGATPEYPSIMIGPYETSREGLAAAREFFDGRIHHFWCGEIALETMGLLRVPRWPSIMLRDYGMHIVPNLPVKP